ncbi:MAG: hypothetical protein OK438_04040 [Thaumarchaeota archaeon]|nr:hypothetical protein [Nitrososphaerota archaeon]
MSKDASKDDYFNEGQRHSLVQDFSVAYYNRDVIPDVTDKDANNEDVNFAFSKGENGSYKNFYKLRKSEVVSYEWDSSYSRYEVKLVDERFKELNALLDKYSDADTPSTDKLLVEKELYRLIRILMKEGRVPKTFKLQPFRDAQMSHLASSLERTTKLLDTLEKRVRGLEDLAGKIPR